MKYGPTLRCQLRQQNCTQFHVELWSKACKHTGSKREYCDECIDNGLYAYTWWWPLETVSQLRNMSLTLHHKTLSSCTFNIQCFTINTVNSTERFCVKHSCICMIYIMRWCLVVSKMAILCLWGDVHRAPVISRIIIFLVNLWSHVVERSLYLRLSTVSTNLLQKSAKISLNWAVAFRHRPPRLDLNGDGAADEGVRM